MEINVFLDFTEKLFSESNLVLKHVKFLGQPDVDIHKQHFQVALLGIPDEKDSLTFESANLIREQLYQLTSLSNKLSILDLGNIKPGHHFKDACVAISEVIQLLSSHGIVLLLMGGTSQFELGRILAYKNNPVPMNLVSVDSRFTKERIEGIFSLENLENDLKREADLYNFINIGYQSYFISQPLLDYVDDCYYEAYRLGIVRNDLKEIEPVLRDANHLAFSLNSVKHADAPGANNPSPNGFTGDEICQLAFYAGHSNRISSMGIYDLSVENDIHQITGQLAAQLIWYFLEGFANRILEEPDSKPQNFTKYLIHNNDSNQDLSFYQSNLTNRWWMELFFHDKNHCLILSCSENDYEMACRQEIPDRWWKAFQRIQN